MAFTNPHVAPWIAGERLNAAIMQAITSALPKAVDGIGGGTYSLTAALSLLNQLVTVTDLKVNNDVEVDADVDIAGELSLGGDLNSLGEINTQGSMYAQLSFQTDGPLTADTVAAQSAAFVGLITAGTVFTPAVNTTVASVGTGTFTTAANFQGPTRHPMLIRDADPGMLPGRRYLAQPTTARTWALPTTGILNDDWIEITVDHGFTDIVTITGFPAGLQIDLSADATGPAGNGRWRWIKVYRAGGVWHFGPRGF